MSDEYFRKFGAVDHLFFRDGAFLWPFLQMSAKDGFICRQKAVLLQELSGIPNRILPMLNEEVFLMLEKEFRMEFTSTQRRAAMLLAHFVTTPRKDAACILRGYAGTGKTSLVGALVRVMRQLEREVVLLAPTGRAAKVFALHAQMPAYTIHRVIYRQNTFEGEGTRFSLGYNKLRNALFVVDEASMLGSGSGAGGNTVFGTGELMDDLVRFVYEGEGCRLLLVGDTAQLPPVGETESPALQNDTLARYGLLVGSADLTEVVRQSRESDVLAGATMLRQLLGQDFEGIPPIHTSPKGEVRALPGNELIESLVGDYREYGTNGVIVVTRSNKRANIYNNGIRSRVFDREEELTRGDLVMAVKNNYYWTEQAAKSLGKDERLPMTFVANGDTAEVVRIRHVHEQHGFRFADATLRFPDYDDFELECRVLLSTLQSESPSLTREESNSLFERVLQDYLHIPNKRERMKTLRQDAYYNAIQLKYAYAVTCHKAQGGQWARVYVDQGFVPEDETGAAYLRWLYTAFTRTTERVYLVNWKTGTEE